LGLEWFDFRLNDSSWFLTVPEGFGSVEKITYSH
jgi:hypothetical protein